jgi:hypothetical protein
VDNSERLEEAQPREQATFGLHAERNILDPRLEREIHVQRLPAMGSPTLEESSRSLQVTLRIYPNIFSPSGVVIPTICGHNLYERGRSPTKQQNIQQMVVLQISG